MSSRLPRTLQIRAARCVALATRAAFPLSSSSQAHIPGLDPSEDAATTHAAWQCHRRLTTRAALATHKCDYLCRPDCVNRRPSTPRRARSQQPAGRCTARKDLHQAYVAGKAQKRLTQRRRQSQASKSSGDSKKKRMCSSIAAAKKLIEV